MNFVSRLQAFRADEEGAVTIDWVALTAGILLLGIAVVFSIFSYGVDPLVQSANEELEGAPAGLCEGIEGGSMLTEGDCAKFTGSDYQPGDNPEDSPCGAFICEN